MGADTVTINPQTLANARSGIALQLEATTNLVEQFGSLAQAVETLGLADFLENQAQVIASGRAWVDHTNKLLSQRDPE